jgi:stearoyl-CoA desaturase (Delta-9 desaturase)
MAIVTLGEGYHNYHHEFQHDYRNGVKPWHFDPTKWIIWTMSKIGLAKKLRRVPEEKVILAELHEAQLRLATSISGDPMAKATSAIVAAAYERLLNVEKSWLALRQQEIAEAERMIPGVRREIRTAVRVLSRTNPRRPEIALRVGDFSEPA